MYRIFFTSLAVLTLSGCVTVAGDSTSQSSPNNVLSEDQKQIPEFNFVMNNEEKEAGRETALNRCVKEEEQYQMKYFPGIQYQSKCFGLLNLQRRQIDLQPQRAQQL